MKNKNTNLVWGIVVVAIIIILALLMVRAKNNKENADVNNYTDMAPVTVEGEEDTTPVTTPVAVSTPASLSYQQALVKYKDRRIQFDQACQTTPNNMTFKSGTAIMLDNRASVARNININGPVSIKAYGFKIVTLSSSTLPKTILVDCGSGQNVATILLQK
jgi:hypothetical protein